MSTGEARLAIAFLRKDATETPQMDAKDLQRYARRQGFDLVKTMVIEPGALDPTLRLINAMHHHSAVAVLVPTLNHLAKTRRAITEQWDLVTVDTDKVYSRGHRWPRPVVGA